MFGEPLVECALGLGNAMPPCEVKAAPPLPGVGPWRGASEHGSNGGSVVRPRRGRPEEETMATLEMRKLKRQIVSKLHEYEGHLMRLEGQLLILRAKSERVAGEVGADVGSLLARGEQGVEKAREIGRAALAELERAAEAAQASLQQLTGELKAVEEAAPKVVEKGRTAVRRATIEAKALRHGVKVGIRVARRVSRRKKTEKA